MDAYVTVKIRIKNVCNWEDLEASNKTFDEAVMDGLEALKYFVDGNYIEQCIDISNAEILKIEKVQ